MPDVFEVEVEIDAPRDRVWRALTDPRELKVWFCEHADVSDDRYEFWGRYTPDAPTGAVQRLVKLEPERTLVYTWTFRGADTTVEITLDADTHVHVLHSDVPDRTEGGSHLSTHFWANVLADLKGHLEIGKTAPRFDYSWPHHGGFEAEAYIDAPREAVWDEFERRHEASGMPLRDGSGARHPAAADMKIFDVRPLHGWKMEWNDDSADVGRGARTVQTFTLSDSGGGTRVTIVHSGFAAEADVQGMAEGFFSGVQQIAWALYTDGVWPSGPGVRVTREARHGSFPEELLADAVRGRSDDEIDYRLGGWGGSAGVLRFVFPDLADRVDPRSPCIVSFDVGAGYTLRVAPGSVTGEPRIAADAEAVVRMTTPDFLRMLVREVTPEELTDGGRLVVEGDADAARRLFEMLPAGRGAHAS